MHVPGQSLHWRLAQPDMIVAISIIEQATDMTLMKHLCNDIYAVNRIMPHGRVWRWFRLRSAMQQFGIIRVSQERQAIHRWDDIAPVAFQDG